MMELDITWDPVKAQTNLSKHGVSFTQAASVLLDPLALTVFDAAHSDQEERWFTLGQALDGTLLAIAHTYQSTGPDTASRTIDTCSLSRSSSDSGMRDIKPTSLGRASIPSRGCIVIPVQVVLSNPLRTPGLASCTPLDFAASA